jgi:hypothetical protein
MINEAWEEIKPLIYPYIDDVLIGITIIAVAVPAIIFIPKLIYYLMYRNYIVTNEDFLLVRSIRTHIKHGAYLILEFDDGGRCLFREPDRCLCIEGDLLPVTCKVNTKNNTIRYFYENHFIVKRYEETDQEQPKVIDFRDRVRGLVSNGS